MASRIPRKIVEKVLARDKHLCMLRITPDCLGEASCADHRANRGQGGAKGRLDTPSCLVAACGLCNGAKADGTARQDLLDRGISVLPDSTHEKTAERCRTTPVLYTDGLFYLDNQGNRLTELPY